MSFIQEDNTLDSEIICPGAVDPRVSWLDRSVFRRSWLTMRYHASLVEHEYIRFCYSNITTWFSTVATGVFMTILIIAHAAAAATMTNTELFIMAASIILCIALSCGLLLASFCLHFNGRASQLIEQQRLAYVMEMQCSALMLVTLAMSSYMSFSSIHRHSHSLPLHGTTFDPLFASMMVLTMLTERPRCIFSFPILAVTAVTAVVGAFQPHPTSCLRGSLQRDLQLGFCIVTVVLSGVFRFVRERQMRRHFQQFSTMFSQQDELQIRHNDLIRVVDRFVPSILRRNRSVAMDTNVKAVLFLVEITAKDLLLPKYGSQVVVMSKLILRLETQIKKIADLNGVERITFEGDSFCCVSGLENKADVLGSRTYDAVRCAFTIVSEVGKWDLIDDVERASRSEGVDSDAQTDEQIDERDNPITVRAALHTGFLYGCAIGRSTFQYSFGGECLSIARTIVSHANACQLIVTRSAAEACGGKVKIIPLHPMEVVVDGTKETMITFYVVGISGDDDEDDQASPQRDRPILDFLVTPQFPETVEMRDKDSISLLMDMVGGEKSAASGIASMSGPSLTEGPPSINTLQKTDHTPVVHPSPFTSGCSPKRPKHFFSDAIRREVLISEHLQRDIQRCRSTKVWIMEHFVEREQEMRFYRFRSTWHMSLRLALLGVCFIVFILRRLWADFIAADHESHERADFGDMTNQWWYEVGLLCAASAVFLTRTILTHHLRSRNFSLLLTVWRLENTAIGALLLCIVGHTFMGVSTWSRELSTLLWIGTSLLLYAHLPFLTACFLAVLMMVAAITFYMIVFGAWSAVDIIHLIVIVVGFVMNCSVMENQDRRFFIDTITSKAASLALVKKQHIFGGVLRATIPSLLHTFHRTLLARHASLPMPHGTAVIMHDNLIIAQIMWRCFSPSSALFDRVSSVEQSIQAANEVLDVVLRRNKEKTLRSTAFRGDSSDSEVEMEVQPIKSRGGSTSTHQEERKPSLCMTRMLGDVVTIAGLPATNSGSRFSAFEKQTQVATLIACVAYALGHLWQSQPRESSPPLSGMIGLGLGASTMSYDDDTKYAIFGAPITEVGCLLPEVPTGGIGATSRAVIAMREQFPEPSVELPGEACDGLPCIHVRVGPEKRWCVKGIGNANVHMLSMK